MLGVALALAASTVALSSAQATPTDNVQNGGIGELKVVLISAGKSTSTTVQATRALGGITCGGFWQISKSHPGHDSMLRVAHIAQLTGRIVDFGYETISGVCWLKEAAIR
jgi:hypothetical protein